MQMRKKKRYDKAIIWKPTSIQVKSLLQQIVAPVTASSPGLQLESLFTVYSSDSYVSAYLLMVHEWTKFFKNNYQPLFHL